MSKRATEPAAPKRPANLPSRAIPEAVRKLENRRADFQQADPASHESLWDLAVSLCNKLAATVAEVFGPETLEADRLRVVPSSFTVNVAFGDGPSRSEEVRAFESGRRTAITRIEAELAILRDRIEEGDGNSTTSTLRAYQGLELHSVIQDAAGELFRNGHYANAIEDAVKALNGWVRLRSGLELDGTTLMERAFGPNNPVLRFNDLADDSDRSEQKGVMQLFSGAVAG